MVIDSTSFGLILLISPVYGKLSTTISGLGLAKMVLLPRIVIVEGFNSGRLFLLNINPLVTPSNRSNTPVETLLFNNLLSTLENDPGDFSFVVDEYPFTTTSLISLTRFFSTSKTGSAWLRTLYSSCS
jgi:hypothetical protein